MTNSINKNNRNTIVKYNRSPELNISTLTTKFYFKLFIITVLLINIVPGEPQDFKVVKVTSNTIDLEWKAPRREEQSTSNNIKGYEIHYFKVNPSASSSGSASASPNNDAFLGKDIKSSDTQIFKQRTNDNKKLKYTLTNLDPNSLYKIQIFAYNMKGDGQRSNPLMVNTLDDGPNKPENIRSEIHDNLLHIKWQPPSPVSNSPSGTGSAQTNINPSSANSPVITAKLNQQQVGGYRIYFNNEKYEVDASTNQITFQRPKWGLL